MCGPNAVGLNFLILNSGSLVRCQSVISSCRPHSSTRNTLTVGKPFCQIWPSEAVVAILVSLLVSLGQRVEGPIPTRTDDFVDPAFRLFVRQIVNLFPVGVAEIPVGHVFILLVRG